MGSTSAGTWETAKAQASLGDGKSSTSESCGLCAPNNLQIVRALVKMKTINRSSGLLHVHQRPSELPWRQHQPYCWGSFCLFNRRHTCQLIRSIE